MYTAYALQYSVHVWQTVGEPADDMVELLLWLRLEYVMGASVRVGAVDQ